jgi:hypothetical protein
MEDGRTGVLEEVGEEEAVARDALDGHDEEILQTLLLHVVRRVHACLRKFSQKKEKKKPWKTGTAVEERQHSMDWRKRHSTLTVS